VLGLENDVVEKICESTPGVVVAANYNCPGQLVISGDVPAVEAACAALSEAGARRALMLPVGGAFHSPLMEPAREELAAAIDHADIQAPRCAIYQNVSAAPTTDPAVIREQLVAQLTAPVRWTQTMEAMIADGATEVTEVGPGKVLQGLFKKVDRAFPTVSAGLEPA
jgi:[acyl-carrier-protein] S-malonyltransferase